MINIKNFKLPTEFQSVVIEPEELLLEKRKFFFEYKQERVSYKPGFLPFLKKKVVEEIRHTNVVVIYPENEGVPFIGGNFSEKKLSPGSIINYNGEDHRILETQNEDGSYDLVRLPYIGFNNCYINSVCYSSYKYSFRNKEDIKEFVKYLISKGILDVSMLYQDGNTDYLIKDIDNYLKKERLYGK